MTLSENLDHSVLDPLQLSVWKKSCLELHVFQILADFHYFCFINCNLVPLFFYLCLNSPHSLFVHSRGSPVIKTCPESSIKWRGWEVIPLIIRLRKAVSWRSLFSVSIYGCSLKTDLIPFLFTFKCFKRTRNIYLTIHEKMTLIIEDSFVDKNAAQQILHLFTEIK